MLVLSRKLGEAIVIDGRITVTVVDIDRGKIRLGVQAAREIPIFRSELLAAEGGVRKKSGQAPDGPDGPHAAGEGESGA